MSKAKRKVANKARLPLPETFLTSRYITSMATIPNNTLGILHPYALSPNNAIDDAINPFPMKGCSWFGSKPRGALSYTSGSCGSLKIILATFT